MSNSNDRPITLISGTSKGIGRELAEYFVKKGHIVVGFSRSEGTFINAEYTHYRGDIADEAFIVALLRSIKKEYGRLDNLINNAGIASMNHALLTPRLTIEKILNINIAGTFLLCRESAKLMKKNKYGRIVNFSSVAVPLKIEGEAIYAASKAAVVSLTQILAKEFAEFQITVNAVSPNPIETDLIKGVSGKGLDNILSSQAIKRFGTVSDVINVVDFFLQKTSSFITGQQLFLGGVS